MKKTLKERFEEKVELIPFSTCHWWTGAMNNENSQYGRVFNQGKLVRAHRAAYELYIGPINDGMQVLHRCDQPSCVNPAHLFLGTAQDNMTDKVNKGRQKEQRGECGGAAKLTNSDVLSIRRLAGLATQKELGAMFGVSECCVSNIVCRKTWVHI